MRKTGRGWCVGILGRGLTCEELFVDARELYVSFRRARDDQTVNDSVRDGLSHGMPQQALHHHRAHVRKQGRVSRARQIRERGVLQSRRGRRREAQHVARPAIDRALELRGRVLSCASINRQNGGDGGSRATKTTGHIAPSPCFYASVEERRGWWG
jgi:hypothetical protein